MRRSQISFRLPGTGWHSTSRSRHSGFARLLTLYEHNYLRLQWLVPGADRLMGQTVSVIHDGLPLYLEVLAQSRYTTTLRLTHRLDLNEGEQHAPNVCIRLYHDAGLAEAVSHEAHVQPLRAEDMPAAELLSRKLAMNRFLAKWLGYCLRQGHGFGRDDDGSATAPALAAASVCA